MVTIFPDCTTAQVGSSTKNSITKTIANGYNCPASVDKTNWLDGHTYPDTFSITQNGNQITVKRTDSTVGWGMNLKFTCCKDKGTRMIVIFRIIYIR